LKWLRILGGEGGIKAPDGGFRFLKQSHHFHRLMVLEMSIMPVNVSSWEKLAVK